MGSALRQKENETSVCVYMFTLTKTTWEDQQNNKYLKIQNANLVGYLRFGFCNPIRHVVIHPQTSLKN